MSAGEIKKGALFLEINGGYVNGVYPTKVDGLKAVQIIVTTPYQKQTGETVLINKSVFVETTADLKKGDIISGIADYQVNRKGDKFYTTYKLLDFRFLKRGEQDSKKASQRLFGVKIEAVSKYGIKIKGKWFNFTERTKLSPRGYKPKKGDKVNIYYIQGEKANFLNAVFSVNGEEEE